MWSEWRFPDAGLLSEQHSKFREAYSAILQGTFHFSGSTMFKILALPSSWQLVYNHCQKLPEGSKKRKRMENPKRISIKCHDTLTFQCPNLKLIEIKYKEEDVDQLLGLLSGIWRNLRKTTIMLTEAWNIQGHITFWFWALVLLKCSINLSMFLVFLDVKWKPCLPSKYV